MQRFLVPLLVLLTACYDVQVLALPSRGYERRATKSSSPTSVTPAPSAHGIYNIEGYGIRGPPASGYTVFFRPGGTSLASSPAAPSTSTPARGGKNTTSPSPSPSSSGKQGDKARKEADRRRKEAARYAFTKTVPRPVQPEDGDAARMAEEEVEQLVRSGIGARRARQMVLNSLQANQTTPPAANRTRPIKTYRLAARPSADTLANLSMISTSPSYSVSSIRSDLHLIRSWASDLNHLAAPELLDETVAAISSASSRYYPDLPTLAASRLIISDMLAESDFQHDLVAGARLDSGSAWGLMQVSPFGSGQELDLFKKHAVVTTNTYSWATGTGGGGELKDWKTGKLIDLQSLTSNDLLRPWVNVHVASWVQSNLARTGSQDPYSWTAIAKASSRALKISSSPSASASNSSSTEEADRAWQAYTNLLRGVPGIKPTFKTGLGSWVAGPAASGTTGYAAKGDDISKQYFERIAKGLSVLYGTNVKPAWMDTLVLEKGLIDYR